MTPLTLGARRRATTELADIYLAEQAAADRPITEALPALLDALRGFTVPSDRAVSLFDQFARQRAISCSATASYAEMDAAERRAEWLLDELLGEVLAVRA